MAVRPASLLIAAALLLPGASGWTQDAGADADQPDAVDEASPDGGFDAERDQFTEIVVTPGHPGDSIDVQLKYEELLRERLLKDIDMRRLLEEEYEWRKTDAAKVDGPYRIRWGYDPRDDLKLRDEADLTKHEYDTVRPATIFRVEF